MSHEYAVLIVEDEALVRWDLAGTFGDAGFRTREAASAEEAIKILEDDASIAIVMTDIEMPGTMDGLMLARYIRERWPSIFIIICSGRVTPLKTDMPRDAAFIEKPYNAKQLENILNRARHSIGRGPNLGHG